VITEFAAEPFLVAVVTRRTNIRLNAAGTGVSI
jgi:hypothetical protein